MAGPYKVNVRVMSQKGTCANEHKVGDQWVVEGTTPAGICLSAFDSLYPKPAGSKIWGVVPVGGGRS